MLVAERVVGAQPSGVREAGQTWSREVPGPSGSDWDAGLQSSTATPEDPAGGSS